MSYADSEGLKALQIAVNVGVNVTADMAAAVATTGADPYIWFVEHLDGVVNLVVATHAEQKAHAAFGAVVDPNPPAPAVAPATFTPPTQVAAPAVQAPVVQAPAPIPMATVSGAVNPETERRWTLFFQNPDAWYNNIGNKKNPKQPDFRHKTEKGADGYPLGLWIQDKGNPAWVAEGLRQIGLVA